MITSTVYWRVVSKCVIHYLIWYNRVLCFLYLNVTLPLLSVYKRWLTVYPKLICSCDYIKVSKLFAMIQFFKVQEVLTYCMFLNYTTVHIFVFLIPSHEVMNSSADPQNINLLLCMQFSLVMWYDLLQTGSTFFVFTRSDCRQTIITLIGLHWITIDQWWLTVRVKLNWWKGKPSACMGT